MIITFFHEIKEEKKGNAIIKPRANSHLKSFSLQNSQAGGAHVHDYALFKQNWFNLTHTINALSFGVQFPGVVNPLDGASKEHSKAVNKLYQYYISKSIFQWKQKILSTCSMIYIEKQERREKLFTKESKKGKGKIIKFESKQDFCFKSDPKMRIASQKKERKCKRECNPMMRILDKET